MSMQVNGDNLYDVLAKLGKSQSVASGWLVIDPYSNDYGGMPTGKFKVRWVRGEESFTKIVTSEAELLTLIRPLISDYTAWFKKSERDRKAQEKAAARATLRAAEQKLREAKQAFKAIV